MTIGETVIRRFDLLLTAVLVMTHSAAARDIFVDNLAGNDFSDGVSASARVQGSGPCRSITKALRLANKGDRIIVANTGQPYREAVALQGGRNSGYPGQPFTIVGNGAVLDGSLAVPSDGWEFVDGSVFRFRPARLSYPQLFLDDRPAHRQRISPTTRLPKLQPLEWCRQEHYIYFRAEKGKIPQDYNLTHAGLTTGITLYEVRNVEIHDLVVQGYQLDGVSASDSAFDVNLVGLTCRGNGRSGISVGGASRISIAACLIGNNGQAQVRTEGWSHTRIINCDLLDDTAPALLRHGGEVTVEDDSRATDGS